MLLHLPPTSHVRRLLSPESARVAEWTTPEVTLLGFLHDQADAQYLLSRGVDPKDLPPEGVISRILSPRGSGPDVNRGEKSAPVSTVADRDKKALTAAAQIRAQMK